MWLPVQLTPDQSIDFTDARAVILSPDGKQLIYVAGSGQDRQLYVRALDRLESTPLSGTAGALSPFFSPDGEWVAFFLGPGGQRTLKKVPVKGGTPVTISQEPHPGFSGSWGTDGTIIIGNQVSVLSSLSDNGGMPKPLTVLHQGEVAHVFPQILPGGEAVLFTAQVSGNWNDAQIVLQMMGTGERKVLINGGTDARYVPTGHLVYSQNGMLLAVPFDLSSLEVTGNPVSILDLVSQVGTGAAQYSFSDSGSLVYLRGTGGNERLVMVWVDRDGHEMPLTAAPPNSYGNPRLSPDGRRVAVGFRDSGNFDLLIHDLARGTMARLTFEAAMDLNPIWTTDGQRVVFSSTREDGFENLYWRTADGTGQVERLTKSPDKQSPYAFSPDGKQLVFTQRTPAMGWDINMLSMEGELVVKPLIQTSFHEDRPALSSDGRWLAYHSNESGHYEVFVRPFPNVGDGKWQISSDGGTSPVWGPEGQELFYRNGDAMMEVGIETEPTFTPGSPVVLFTGRYDLTSRRNYDISPNSQQFLMVKNAERPEEASARTEVIIVLNWFEELKERVPVP
jgi:serine/threonine-protein kinase